MLTLKDLSYVPGENTKIEKGRIEVCKVGKQFHYNCLDLNLGIDMDNGRYSKLFNMINIGDEYMANILNLLFELYANHMDHQWEYLSLSNLEKKSCLCAIEDDSFVAIGYNDKWINQKEVLALLKKKRQAI